MEYDGIVSDVKRNSNEFSFIDTFYEMINNENFRSGFKDFGSDTKYNFIWQALSAIGQDVGDTIYENVLNYIDRASNIDLCKTKALRSIVSNLGISFSILDNINIFPQDLIDLIDVLSINKKYLLQTDKFKQSFISDLKDKIYQTVDIDAESLHNTVLSGFSVDELSAPGVLTEENYRDYISNLYSNYMEYMVNLPYNTGLSAPIWWIDNREILEGKIDEDSDQDQITELKKKYNIQNSFDEQEVVDNIDNGSDSIENYSGAYETIIEKEIERRAKTLSITTLTDDTRKQYKSGFEADLRTRYSYYRKEKVKTYINMIETQYNGLDDLSSFSDYTYPIDDNYLQIRSDLGYRKLIDSETARTTDYEGAVDYDMIHAIADKIADITIKISKLRELLKIEAQKNFTKGTFNLLSYIVNQYLVELSKSSTITDDPDLDIDEIRGKLRSHSVDDIGILEYFDTTEYFNISSDTSVYAKDSKFVNPEYWDQDDKVNSNSGFSFTQSDVDDFYKKQMEPGDCRNNIKNFLDTVAKLGASDSHVDINTGKTMVSGEDDIKDSNEEIFLSYSGKRIGYSPYSNIKNRTHSSFQPHPHLYNFISYLQYDYPVVNGFYNDTVIEATEEEVVSQLSNILGSYGQPINIATQNQYDYSGYRSEYEDYYQQNNNDNFGYDGPFYTPAANDFKSYTANFINSVRNMDTGTNTVTYFEKYYSKLRLTSSAYEYIADQLNANKTLINSILAQQNDIKNVYDIYKYTEDKYQNSYILYKKYSSADPSEEEKRNTPGQLWIRLKNHPIAFPAFYGTHPAVETSQFFNRNIEYLATVVEDEIDKKTELMNYKHDLENDTNQMAYIYDIELSPEKDVLFMAVYPKNDLKKNGTYGRYSDKITQDYYKNYQQADIVISKIYQEYDSIEKRTKLYMSSASEGLLIKDNTYIAKDIDDSRYIEGISFLGFFKDTFSIAPVFFQKTLDKTNKTYNYDSENMRIYIYKYTAGELTNRYIDMKLNFSQIDKYKTVNGDVQFSYHDDILTFAFLTQPEQDDIQIQNYVGMSQSNGKENYLSFSEDDSSDSVMNSFDSMSQFINILDTYIDSGELKVLSNKAYNVHGSASYIPVYPSYDNRCDIYQTEYRNNVINSFELLGKSRDIDAIIANTNPDADIEVDAASVADSYALGRVWEESDGTDQSLVKLEYSQYLDTYNHDSGYDNNGYILWKIDVASLGYKSLDYSNITFVLYNRNNYGKNPYFIGQLSELVSNSNISLKNDKQTYNGYSESSSIVSSNNSSIQVTGTYNYEQMKTSSKDSNHINNVSDILIRLTSGNIYITFCPDDPDESYFIEDKIVVAVFCNQKDISAFENYHILDHLARVKNGKIGGVDLSAIHLSSYQSLDQVPGLSGTNNLSFKYSEEDVFDITSRMYYFPGFNTAYPYRQVDYYSDYLNDQNYSVSQINTEIFNESNLFCIRIDGEDIIDRIGKISIPILKNEVDCYRSYEDGTTFDVDGTTLSVRQIRQKYDSVNPRLMNCIKFFDNSSESTDRNIDINDNRSLDDYAYDIMFENGKVKAATLETQSLDMITTYVVTTPTVNKSGYDKYNGITDLLNIFVNYKKEDDDTITLYFNYYNYINTPYVKIEDNRTKIDTIEGTYLKLKSGENGILDIVLQFKYFQNETELYGVQNIKVVSYQIYNVSDTKPKFLITNIYKIPTGDNERVEDSTTIIRVDSQTILLSDIPTSQNNDQLSFSVNVSVTSNISLKSSSFTIKYPTNFLTLLPGNDYNSSTTAAANGRIALTTKSYATLNFQTKSTIGELRNTPLSFQLGITSVSMTDTYGNTPTIRTIVGDMMIVSGIYLGQEDYQKHILTEYNKHTEGETGNYINT